MFHNELLLKDDIGSDRPVDEEDTLALKQALKKIGRYKTPSYGDTPYPDQQMFTAIDDIQKEKKLIRDGIMKPGGETETAINEELRGKNLQDLRVGFNQKSENTNDTGLWKIKEINRLNNRISKTKADIARNEARERGETGPEKAATRSIIRQLKRTLRDLEDELIRVESTRDA